MVEIHLSELGAANANPRETLWYPSETNDFVIRWKVPSNSTEGPQKASEKWLTELKEQLSGETSKKRRCPQTIEDNVTVYFDNVVMPARGLITYCNKQNLISASLRLSGKGTPPHHVELKVCEGKALFTCKRVDRKATRFLFSPDTMADLILQKLDLLAVADPTKVNPPLGFHTNGNEKLKQSHPAGLIVIAGGTGTGKSEIARGVILRWLLRLARQAYVSGDKSKFDPPHLVTFEDPIESWKVFGYPMDMSKQADPDEWSLLDEAESDLSLGIRVTSRAKDYDVEDLKSSCMHALRQKPNVVYIGESRQVADWDLALELGGTGHLVVTTCHSSSLVDTFVKLAGKRAGNAQGRQELGNSLLGVIHLKNAELSQTTFASCPTTKLASTQTFVQLWRRTPESLNNLVVDGLSSLVTDGQNVIARKIMTREALALQRSSNFDFSTDGQFFDEAVCVAEEAAFGLDLRAL